MKLIVSSGLLLKKLNAIVGIIGNNTVLPILEDFHFDINKKSMNITATDLETSIKVSIDVEAEDKRKICIPAKILMETLKNLPEQPLTFNIDDKNAIDITSDSGKYKIMGEGADSFPKEPNAEGTSNFNIKSIDLVTAITKTLVSASNDDLRPAMMGVYVDMAERGITFVSTDAHRLTKYTVKDAQAPGDDNFIIPKKPLNILKTALPSTDEVLELSYNKNHLFVKTSNLELTCRLIDARFPDYKVVIPKGNPYSLSINKNDLIGALRRVNVFANKSSTQVLFNITGSSLQLSAQDIDLSFEGNETLNCQYDGDDMSICYNGKFLLEMLQNATNEELIMTISTPNKASLILPKEQAEGEDLLMLVMPLMINN